MKLSFYSGLLFAAFAALNTNAIELDRDSIMAAQTETHAYANAASEEEKKAADAGAAGKDKIKITQLTKKLKEVEGKLKTEKMFHGKLKKTEAIRAKKLKEKKKALVKKEKCDIKKLEASMEQRKMICKQ